VKARFVANLFQFSAPDKRRRIDRITHLQHGRGNLGSRADGEFFELCQTFTPEQRSVNRAPFGGLFQAYADKQHALSAFYRSGALHRDCATIFGMLDGNTFIAI
jgi:hypothetical protein